MASIHIHLVVGIAYFEKHSEEIKDKDQFMMGIIAPDFASDDKKSHYSGVQDKKV